MPTLVFSVIVSSLQEGRYFIEEIGNHLVGAYEPVWLPFVGFVTVPMIERRLPTDKPAATVRTPVGIVVTHQPPPIRGMEGQRIRNTVRLLSRPCHPLDRDPTDLSPSSNDLF